MLNLISVNWSACDRRNLNAAFYPLHFASANRKIKIKHSSCSMCMFTASLDEKACLTLVLYSRLKQTAKMGSVPAFSANINIIKSHYSVSCLLNNAFEQGIRVRIHHFLPFSETLLCLWLHHHFTVANSSD